MVSEVNENQGSKVQYFGPHRLQAGLVIPLILYVRELTRLSDQLNVLGHPPL